MTQHKLSKLRLIAITFAVFLSLSVDVASAATLLSDDFNASQLDTSKWGAVGTGIVQNGDGVVSIPATSSNGWNSKGITSVSTFDRSNLVITARAKVSVAASIQALVAYGDPSAGVSTGSTYWMTTFNSRFYCFRTENNFHTEVIDSGISVASNTFYTVKMTVGATSGASFSVDSGSGFVNACSVVGGTFNNKKVFFQTYSSNSILSVDSVLVEGGALPVDSTGPELSSIAATATSSAATIAWNTNELASSQISYGVTSSYGTTTSEADISPRVTAHSVGLTGLTPNTTYHYQIISRDASGNTTTSSDQTFTTTDITPTITITSPTLLRTIIDQQYSFSIPWIQTSSTLTVTATATDIPNGGGIKFVVDEGTAYEYSQTDMTSPYSVSFDNLRKAEHTIKAYAVSSEGVLVSNTAQASLSNIAIGDIISVIGDSTSSGYRGNTVSGTVANCAAATFKTADCRTYEQRDGDGSATRASYLVELATKLADYYGYPVFMMNEGWGSSDTYHFTNTIAASSQFQNRMNDLRPNKFLINYGINDVRCETGCAISMPVGERNPASFGVRLQSVINILKNSYGASNEQLYLARFSYDTTLTAYSQNYLPYILSTISNNPGIKYGPNLYDYFIGKTGSLYQDNVHPNATGFTQVARLWGIAIMKPSSFTATQSDGAVTLSWADLSTDESSIEGYTVRYGTSSGVYMNTVDVGNVTSKQITGLIPGQTYYFAVSGYDNDSSLVHESDNSIELSLTITVANPITPPLTTVTGYYPQVVNPATSQSSDASACTTSTRFSPVTGAACPISKDTQQSKKISYRDVFKRSLAVGSVGVDVKALQVFLNTNGFTVAEKGVGSKGRETNYFGPSTKAAVRKFQIANTIKPSTGFFGPITRSFVIGF